MLSNNDRRRVRANSANENWMRAALWSANATRLHWKWGAVGHRSFVVDTTASSPCYISIINCCQMSDSTLLISYALSPSLYITALSRQICRVNECNYYTSNVQSTKRSSAELWPWTLSVLGKGSAPPPSLTFISNRMWASTPDHGPPACQVSKSLLMWVGKSCGRNKRLREIPQ